MSAIAELSQEQRHEAEARSLRDLIYGLRIGGECISDASWASVKGNWVNDLAWLREQAEKIKEVA